MTLLLALALVFGGAMAASADIGLNTWSQYVGQPGGSPFSFSCGNTPLVLLTVTSESVVNGSKTLDSLKASCWNGYTSPTYGVPVGGERHAQCDYGFGTRGVNTYHGWYLNGVQLFCSRLAAPGTQTTGWVGGTTGTYTALRCAAGYHVRQIRGYHGNYIDRFAVYCGSV